MIASQTKCPPGLNVHEYISFQALFSGKSRRWPQILVELGSSNINFSTEGSAALMNFLTLQAGPANVVNANDPLGIVHGIARDADFCSKLLEQLNHRLDGITFNWRETNSMEMLITISMWLFEFSNDIRSGAAAALHKARNITLGWITALRADLRNSADSVAIRNCSRYLFWAALLCRRTFGIYEGALMSLEPEALVSYINCSITLQDNLVADPASLPNNLRCALIRDFKMAYRLRYILKSALIAHPQCLASAITSIWPGSQQREFSSPIFDPEPYQWWVRVVVGATSFSNQQVSSLSESSGTSGTFNPPSIART